MSDHQEIIRVGIIGYGFMGRTHAKAYKDAQVDGYPVRLSAIANRDIQSKIQSGGSGNIHTEEIEVDLKGIELHNQAESIINHPELDLISICTHTETHVDLAIAALEADKHVLVEKPVAIKSSDVQRLAEAADGNDRLCIPAMCMRHWPAWKKIKQFIKSNEYGPVRSAVFHRLGSRPNWAVDFYADQSRSGGVLHDLHIHDTDFIFHCFGKPSSVTSHGGPLHVTTCYHYPNIPHVTAQGAWDNQPAFGFQIKCTIAFESATLDFDLNRKNELILHEGDQSTHIETDLLTGYDNQIRSILEQIQSKSQQRYPIQDAVFVSKILEAEAQSLTIYSAVSLSW